MQSALQALSISNLPVPCKKTSKFLDPSFLFLTLCNYVRALVLAGIALIFFIVASMGLCFGFVLETVLIIQVFVTAEQRLHRVKAFAASHPTPPASRLGVHKKLGGDTAGTADPN